MASGGRAKRFRGNHTHGRGKKAGRGAGLRGGRGRAGANKHRYLMLQLLGGKHEHTQARPWGRIGFKYRSRDGNPKPESVNVGDLQLLYPGKSDIDLTAEGIGKLLGTGNITGKYTIKVESASAGAIEKVKAAGGLVVLPAEKAPKDAKAAPAKSAGGAPSGGKPSGAPAGKGPAPASGAKPGK